MLMSFRLRVTFAYPRRVLKARLRAEGKDIIGLGAGSLTLIRHNISKMEDCSH